MIKYINKRVVLEHLDAYKDITYYVTFVDIGHRCGYVQANIDCQECRDNFDVHGGITYNDSRESPEFPEINGINFIGFDAAHGYDYRDIDFMKIYFPENSLQIDCAARCNVIFGDYFDAKIRTLDYMISECKSLIDQIEAMPKCEHVVNH